MIHGRMPLHFFQQLTEIKTMSTEQTLKINIPGADNGLVNIVRTFIRKRYHLVEDEQADVCIIDLDAYKAKVLLDKIRQQYPVRPIIGLSLNEVEDDNIVYLKKPFRPDDLTQVLDQVSDTLSSPKVVVVDKVVGTINRAAHAVSDKNLDNDRHVAHNGVTNRLNTVHYNPAEYLQSALVNAYQQSTNTGLNLRLDAWWNPIVIFPKTRKIWVDADDKKLQAFCRLPLKTFARHQTDSSNDSNEVKISPEPMLNTDEFPGPLQSMDAFLWKVAWWNAGGQLPLGITEIQPLKLKYWPNITRYLCPDHAVQICALLFQGPVSPLRISQVLDIECKEVYGFISAANALGLIDTLQNKPTEETTSSESTKPATTKRRNTGLLQRILSRLKKQ